MSLDTIPLAAAVASSYDNNKEDNNRSNYASTWGTAYNSYGSDGVCPIASGGGVDSIMEDAINAMIQESSGGVSNLDVMAQALADYWVACHTIPVAPAVAWADPANPNDAQSKVSAFRSALQISITDVNTTPHFKQVFDNIETVVKTLVWTGLDSNSDTVTGNIS